LVVDLKIKTHAGWESELKKPMLLVEIVPQKQMIIATEDYF
jgi:hypothetical protein